jgi:hypothetical protein
MDSQKLLIKDSTAEANAFDDKDDDDDESSSR